MYGDKITSIRLARGYSQNYISNKIGISQKEYSKIERNEKIKFEENLLDKIAETLGVSVDDIKSSTPIVMNFHNNQYDQNVITELTNQLNVKDKQIENLLAQNLHLVLQIGDRT